MNSTYSRLFFLVALSFLFFAGCGTSSSTQTSNLDATALENPVFAGVPVADDVKKEVWARDHKKCVACQGTSDLGYHHKVNPKDGGLSTASNLEIRCRKCAK